MNVWVFACFCCEVLHFNSKAAPQRHTKTHFYIYKFDSCATGWFFSWWTPSKCHCHVSSNIHSICKQAFSLTMKEWLTVSIWDQNITPKIDFNNIIMISVFYCFLFCHFLPIFHLVSFKIWNVAKIFREFASIDRLSSENPLISIWFHMNCRKCRFCGNPFNLNRFDFLSKF